MYIQQEYHLRTCIDMNIQMYMYIYVCNCVYTYLYIDTHFWYISLHFCLLFAWYRPESRRPDWLPWVCRLALPGRGRCGSDPTKHENAEGSWREPDAWSTILGNRRRGQPMENRRQATGNVYKYIIMNMKPHLVPCPQPDSIWICIIDISSPINLPLSALGAEQSGIPDSLPTNAVLN